MSSDPRFGRETGREVFSAAQCLLKGALETVGGVHLLTGYASRSAQRPAAVHAFFEVARSASTFLTQQGMLARAAPSPQAAVVTAAGAQVAGCRAMVVLDMTAMRAASAEIGHVIDTGLAEGAAVLIACIDDDPLAGGGDPRLLAEHLGLPWIEPADIAQVKSRVADAVHASIAAQSPVALYVAPHIAAGGGTVELRANHAIAVNAHQRATLGDDRELRRLAESGGPGRCKTADRLFALITEMRRAGINHLDHRAQKGEQVGLGFLVTGARQAMLSEALRHLDLAGRCPVAVMGMGVPFEDRIVRELLAQCERVIVIEGGSPLLERHAQAVAASMIERRVRAASVWGRRLPFDDEGGQAMGDHPVALARRLAVLLRDHPIVFGPLKPIEREAIGRVATGAAAARAPVDLPQRTPTFPPGSSMRELASVIGEVRAKLLDAAYMQRNHKTAPIALLVHAEADIASLMSQPPHQGMIHRAVGPAGAAAAALGAGPFIANRQMVILSGAAMQGASLAAIDEAIHAERDAVFVVADTAAPDRAPGGLPAAPADPDRLARAERAVRAILPRRAERSVNVVRINPRERSALIAAMEQAACTPGVSVVIADPLADSQPTRDDLLQREAAERAGYAPQATFDHIAEAVCELCLECTRRVGDPAITLAATDYGPKLRIDRSTSANDGAASRIEACPAFEQVTVVRTRPPRRYSARAERIPLPPPTRPRHARQPIWRCRIAGVGDGGVERIASVLFMAGREMGYHVRYRIDPPGGFGAPWQSDLVFMRDPEPATAAWVGPDGVDTLLACDALEAARTIGGAPAPIGPAGVACGVIERATHPTMGQLAGMDAHQHAAVEDVIAGAFNPGDVLRFDFAAACERLLGDRGGAALALLGAAQQRGFLPLTLEAVESVIARLHGPETHGRRAFDLGRRIAGDPEPMRRLIADRRESAARAVRRCAAELRSRFNRRTARRYVRLISAALATLEQSGLGDALRRDVAIRAADCFVWGGRSIARDYLRRLLAVARRDDAEHRFAITRAVAWNLAKVVLIKDECYVAAMLTSPGKLRRDRRLFGVHPARGDRLLYRRDHRPEPVLMGRGLRFEWRSRDWHLRLLARCRFLRRLLPGWSRRERHFRDWYRKLVDRADWPSDAPYDAWLEALRCPEGVTGFREVRYPKMEAAKAHAEAVLAGTAHPRDTAAIPERRAASRTDTRA